MEEFLDRIDGMIFVYPFFIFLTYFKILMMINIAILGSTGSIGKTLFKILKKDKKSFKVQLLTANKNYKSLLSQAKSLNVKNIIITDYDSYQKSLKLNKYKKLKIYNNFNNFNKIFKKKIDYTMSSITGLEGLIPTLKIIKYTKNCYCK